MSSPALRQRYLADSVTTATPGRLLVMLYDRLCLDLARGADAVDAGDRSAASELLLHAQDILLELQGSLRPEAWDGGKELAGIYAFLLAALMRANIAQDAAAVRAALGIVEPLRDAWREAVEALPAANGKS
ncbi:flagellar export chaperone FliS [Actinokineospora globicatena]|uniref:Flagellar protein FliS n=1 Tax=Actinokineospora globicatena TaxID=103729 RepID=A0A9W6QNQ2_9PSEU|nr:flagellar export chaperone FliS [Actinokineospora globicatena]MCP2306232.1 flagellar protein FliS [Actinokineospora globicatena]GLW81658.1 flagellar protein FliS [Actinokineospora globicatena]GLW88452.1 flagellar protein FliS [Actinokineospora globicatena]GLW93135.1 flagellar protein FliS [Actinokineospora globicatena]